MNAKKSGGWQGVARRRFVDNKFIDAWRGDTILRPCYCDGRFLYGTEVEAFLQMRSRLMADDALWNGGCHRVVLEPWQVYRAERCGVVMVSPGGISKMIQRGELI